MLSAREGISWQSARQSRPAEFMASSARNAIYIVSPSENSAVCLQLILLSYHLAILNALYRNCYGYHSNHEIIEGKWHVLRAATWTAALFTKLTQLGMSFLHRHHTLNIKGCWLCFWKGVSMHKWSCISSESRRYWINTKCCRRVLKIESRTYSTLSQKHQCTDKSDVLQIYMTAIM